MGGANLFVLDTILVHASDFTVTKRVNSRHCV